MVEHYEEKPVNTVDMAGTTERRHNDYRQDPDHDHLEADQDRIHRDNGGEISHREQPVALLSLGEADDFRTRWNEIQVGFVDEPRLAVKEADSLVDELMKRLAEIFSEERSHLEGQWSRGDDVSTEELRLALKRYRSFFNRLLSM